MGRDTTASKRMAAKRSREKAAGLRRLNIALAPEVFERLGELMKLHSCTSQAVLIELLVMGKDTDLQPVIINEVCNEVTEGEGMEQHDLPAKQLNTKREISTIKAVKSEKENKSDQKEISTAQLSLF
jgi:hypothetical protein